jgi:hypothetical protein
MQGLGSQLCDHLVKKVINHIEDDINPRIKWMEEACATLSSYEGHDYTFCYRCKTPYIKTSEKVVYCKIEHHDDDCNYSCGEKWCEPWKCCFCDKVLCQDEYYGCSLCDKHGCMDCHEKYSNCDSCGETSDYCIDHYQDNFKNFGGYLPEGYDGDIVCFYIGKVCLECLGTIKCSICKEEYKANDIVDIINIKDCPIEGHEQCGQPICKNCSSNKRIKI